MVCQMTHNSFWEGRYFLWIVKYFFEDREAPTQIKIFVWSWINLFEDCETSGVQN